MFSVLARKKSSSAKNADEHVLAEGLNKKVKKK